MRKIFHVLEKLILILTVICIAFLLIVQITLPRSNNIIPVSKYEYDIKLTPINKYNLSKKGVIALKIIDENLKHTDILVNGEVVDNFEKSNEVNIHVFNNDIIEIDGTKYLEKVKVEVVGVSENIKLPKLNTNITTSQSIEMLGKVTLK